MPDSEVSAILGVSPQYCAMVRSVRDRFPNYSEEELAQEIFNMVRVFDGGRTYKRDYSHFQKFDTKALDEWHALRERQKRFHNDYLNLDAILSDAKHAFFAVTGRDIEWKEIPAESKQLEQQEEEPDEEVGNIGYTQKREHQMELVANMVQNGAITFGTAFEYMNDNNDFRDLDEFTRILDIWIEKGGENR